MGFAVENASSEIHYYPACGMNYFRKKAAIAILSKFDVKSFSMLPDSISAPSSVAD